MTFSENGYCNDCTHNVSEHSEKECDDCGVWCDSCREIEIIEPSNEPINRDTPIYSPDGKTLLGSKHSHFEKSESEIPRGYIKDADGDSKKVYDKETQKKHR